MTQAYSNPARKDDPYALPNIEIWYETWKDCHSPACIEDNDNSADEICTCESGWYYWYCLPGCLPDSDPIGPFESYDAALADAQADSMDESGN